MPRSAPSTAAAMLLEEAGGTVVASVACSSVTYRHY